MKTLRVVVVGAGVAGLAAAHVLRQSPHVDVTVLEGAQQIGGKIRSSEIAGIRVDEGADAVVTRTPEALDLIHEIGLSSQLTNPATSLATVAIGQSRYPLPGKTFLGIPTDVQLVRDSGVLDDSSLNRITDELTKPGELFCDDVSVGDLIRRRLGGSVVERLVDPLLGGVYAGRAEMLSLRATMPQLAAELTKQPSIIAAARNVLAASKKTTSPMFASLQRSLGSLPAALANYAELNVHCGLPVRKIDRTADSFQIISGTPANPIMHTADAVIVATPANKTALMLRSVAPWAASELADIDYASVAIVTLAYPALTLPAGSGMLVPATTRRAIKAITFSSQKWAHLATDQQVIIRVSLGRYGEQQILQRNDADIVHLVQTELAALLGITTQPIDTRVTRWGGALPQYAVGHYERVQRIHADIAHHRGLAVCGAAYDGVGIAACIRSGQKAAQVILGQFKPTPHIAA